MLRWTLALLAGLALASGAAHAQSADDELDRKVAERFEAAQDKFSVGRGRKRFPPGGGGEILGWGA